MEKNNAKCSQLKNLCSLLSLLALNHSHSLEGENTFTLNRTKKQSNVNILKILCRTSCWTSNRTTCWIVYQFVSSNCFFYLLIAKSFCLLFRFYVLFGLFVCFWPRGSIFVRPFCFDRYSKLKRPKLWSEFDWLAGWMAGWAVSFVGQRVFFFFVFFWTLFCFVNVYVLFAWHTVGDTVAQTICYRKTKFVTRTFRHDVI